MTLTVVMHVLETVRDVRTDNERGMQALDLGAVSSGESRGEIGTLRRDRSIAENIFDIIGQRQVCQFHVNKVNLSYRFKPSMPQNIDNVIMVAIANEDVKSSDLVVDVVFVRFDDAHHLSGKNLSTIWALYRVSHNGFRLVGHLNKINKGRCGYFTS
jgi:hypothetical protein